MRTILEFGWHDCREELPEESGTYLICTAYKYRGNPIVNFIEVNYSAKHKLFNAYDGECREDAEDCSIAPDFWCEKDVYDMFANNFELRMED